MTAGKVRFRHDPLTPHETREMEKAGWERREDEDGGISWRQPGPVCTLFPEHGEREWCECWQCDATGVSGHDCGEDCCCCLDPEDNMRCDICGGKGGWWRCYTCAPEQDD